MIYNRISPLQAIRKAMVLLLCSLFASLSLMAQSDSSNVADTTINTTQKTIFKESAKFVEKDTLMGLVMIVCVLAIVVFALFLSFRSPKNGEKRKKIIERQQKRGHTSS